jgi:glycosyltransferase involved in cell wall biosynthesis
MLLSLATRVYERTLEGKQLDKGHIAAWQNFNISRTFLELGFVVDVMNWYDHVNRPSKNYDVFIDVMANLERLSEHVGKNCIKIFHPMFAHWLVHNANTYARHSNLLRRRGVSLFPRRLMPPNNSAEIADFIILRGGPFGNATFKHSPAQIYHIPQLHPFGIDEFLNREMENCRRRFVWLGGKGCVHKGLDLTLEVFKDLPECELYVCGQISGEPDFESMYRRELYETPNIHTIGWIDTTSQHWKQIALRCAGIISPTASELSCGSVICAMRNGLIPVATNEASVDLAEIGVQIQDGSLSSVREAVCFLRDQKPERILKLSQAAYDAAHVRYGRKKFLEAYRKTISNILGIEPLEPWTPWDADFQVPSIQKIEFI